MPVCQRDRPHLRQHVSDLEAQPALICITPGTEMSYYCYYLLLCS